MNIIVCGGENVDAITEILKKDVNIKPFGIVNTSDIENQKRMTGKVEKIIIFEKAINSVYSDIPEMVKGIPTIIIMDDEDKLFNMSIEVFSYSNIQLVRKGNPFPSKFLRDIVINEAVDKEFLYEPKQFGKKEKKVQKIEVDEEKIKALQKEEEERVERIVINNKKNEVEKDEEEQEVKRETIKFSKEEKKEEELKIKVEDEAEKSVKEEGLFLTKEQEVKKRLSLYKNGFVMSIAGTGKSGTSTTVYNIAKAIASLGITTLMVDLDFRKRSLSTMNQKTFEAINKVDEVDGYKKNKLLSAIKKKEIYNNAEIIDDNLFLLSSHICSNLESILDVKNDIKDFLNEARKIYKAIIIDTRLNDINKCPDIILNSDEVVYTIMRNNDSFYELFGELTNINEDEVRERAFSSKVIYYRRGHDKLLFQSGDDLGCIDTFLEREFKVVDNLQFKDIVNVGVIPYYEEADELKTTNKCLFEKHKDLYIDILYNILKM